MSMLRRSFVASLCALAVLAGTAAAAEPMKALIVDGQNNHGVWPKTSKMMKKYLEETGLFTVDIATTADKGEDPEFKPDFSKYNVVVSNYNGTPWPKETQEAFTKFVADGGGFVVVHAANNAFAGWKEYNDMIGLGWRGNSFGDRIVFRDAQLVRVPKGEGPGAGHGPQHEFAVVVRQPDHPITKGLPATWRHAKDELYQGQRGPAENMTVLATAFADPSQKGSGDHEPMLWVIPYGKGRVFVSVLGHADYSQECVGFIATFQRGAEWAATGKVTLPVPSDFPTAEKLSSRKFAD
jgi:type 1 glutamine amidotransferase